MHLDPLTLFLSVLAAALPISRLRYGQTEDELPAVGGAEGRIAEAERQQTVDRARAPKAGFTFTFSDGTHIPYGPS
ncbi:hypothetical protein FB451DRAFT_1409411 [Mycena latifolia]|nr:hypothetical protein FB451DRAFT_1409411 [Mycena latifolia]